MKLHILIPALIALFLSGNSVKGGFPADGRTLKNAKFISLTGESLRKGNRVGRNGAIDDFRSPVLQLLRNASKEQKGTVLLLPGGDYQTLKIKEQGIEFARLLNQEGYDTAVLEYHTGSGEQVRKKALSDAVKAYRYLAANHEILGMHAPRLVIMGISSGGQIAAKTVQMLSRDEQPGDLVLLNPTGMDETIPGTVIPAVMPPPEPSARLFCSLLSPGDKGQSMACENYVKTWKGYDGQVSFHILSDSVAIRNRYPSEREREQMSYLPLKDFLSKIPDSPVRRANSAVIPVEGRNVKRHTEKTVLARNNKYDLILIGNSITHNFEKPAYQEVWNKYFAPRNALNLGYSGYRTEQILWNIQNGELEGQSPKVIILEIGTNNIDEKHYPVRHTAGQLAGGISAVITQLRKQCPFSKIILLRCFPGSYDGPNPTSHRAILDRASEIASLAADGEHVFYCDVNHVFLNLDGSINQTMMSDWLHPTPAGAKAWAQAMEPLLSELMGDKSPVRELPENTAIIPVPKLENDSYNWWDRHAEILRIKDSINPRIVLIGNSITHYWGGEPRRRNSDGSPEVPNGPQTWDSLFAGHRVLNLGFGWDRTQNILWRLDHGELDRLHPATVILHIGTNNTSETRNARKNTPSEIVEGISAVCGRIRSKVPGAHIVLMALFPREESPEHPRRSIIRETNTLLRDFAEKNKLTFLDIGPGMLSPDGTMPREIARDFCHPTERGYKIWAEAIGPFLPEPSLPVKIRNK